MASVTFVGIPFDRHSSYLQGPALAPNRIRSILHSGAGNSYTELNFNVLDHPQFSDAGNFVIDQYIDISTQAEALLKQGGRLLSLGGDHSVTYPLIKAHAQFFEPFTILQIDAHGDLYDDFEGNRYSHACPFARIMEEGLVKRLVQVGIRALSPHQNEQIQRFGVETIEMRHIDRLNALDLSGPLYISLDLDGLDPAFAPGVSHHEPGGLTTRQVLDLIHRLPGPIIGADIVEYNPHRDVSDMTAAVAAKFVKEIAGRMLI